jgi:hypothetical protein
MTRTYNLTSTKINLGASKCFRHSNAPATGLSKPVSDQKKSADPGEWIDAFAFFYYPEAILAKTVLASRRSTRGSWRNLFFRGSISTTHQQHASVR